MARRNGKDAMAFQPVPNTAAVEIRFRLPGNVNAENQLHFTHPDPTFTDLVALVSTIDQYVEETWLPLMGSEVLYVETYARLLNAVEDFQNSQNAGSGPGTAAGVLLPNNASFVLALRSGLTGRSARGRIYLMPPTRNQLQDTNAVTGAVASAWAGALSGMATAAQVVDWEMVIVSRVTGGVKRPTGVTLPVESVGFTDTRLDSQRGRLPATGG